MSSKNKLSKYLGEQNTDLNSLKSETDLGAKSTEILSFDAIQIPIEDFTTIVKKRSIAGSGLIWDNDTFGLWDTYNWGDIQTTSFILGGIKTAILGTSMLGTRNSEWVTIRVINPNRTYTDNLVGTTFKDTTSTATWTDVTSGTVTGIIFGTGNETALSYPVYLNNENLSTATMTTTMSTSTSSAYGLFLSPDGGSNWEEVTSGTSHTFTNTGNDLRWKITGSNLTCSSIKIEY